MGWIQTNVADVSDSRDFIILFYLPSFRNKSVMSDKKQISM